MFESLTNFFGPLMEFISMLITGVKSVISFFAEIGDIILYSIQMLPTDLVAVLVICFGIIIAVRVLELLP